MQKEKENINVCATFLFILERVLFASNFLKSGYEVEVLK